MPLLDDQTRKQVEELFSDLSGPVRLVMFTQEFECQYCKETREIVEEISALSDLIEAEILDFEKDAERAQAYGVDKIPAIVILGENDRDYGVRYYGIPSGYEFSSLLHDIKAVAAGPEAVELDSETVSYLNNLETPLHLQVFVTPTCPYCPRAVVLAHAMAIASDNVRADMVEATEFPHLAMKYNVMGVPRTVINETEFVEGAVPEGMLLSAIRTAVGS
ncbi:MAG TPA: glutaredoxin [Chloroflexi bacterium]|nr:glutaredoxin [Chloroflexota bacterium]